MSFMFYVLCPLMKLYGKWVEFEFELKLAGYCQIIGVVPVMWCDEQQA